MNEFLAELYGTNDIIASDPSEETEKLAAAEFLVKLAAEEGVDLDNLSDDEIGELLAEVEKTASGEPEVDDEAQEKLAEADFLGRAMAHAYVNELSEIEKGAGIRGYAGKAAEQGAKLLQKIKSAPEAIGGAIGGKRLEQYGLKKGKQHAVGRAGALRQAAGTSDPEAIRALELAGGKRGKRIAKVRQAIEKERRGVTGKAIGRGRKAIGYGTLGAGTLGTAAAGTAAAGKEVRQYNEEFEALAQQRAYEMLADAGYDVEKVAEAEMVEAIDQRALEMLDEAGYLE